MINKGSKEGKNSLSLDDEVNALIRLCQGVMKISLPALPMVSRQETARNSKVIDTGRGQSRQNRHKTMGHFLLTLVF